MSSQHDPSGTDAAGDAKSNTGRKVTPALDQKVQDAIGRSLKAHYDDLLNAPVPDRFLSLLAEMEAKEGKRDS